jgi:hypothetical protein
MATRSRTPTRAADGPAEPSAKKASSRVKKPKDAAPREVPAGRPPPDEIADETRAVELLPAAPAWVPTARKVAERRIAGFATSERLLHRRARRPAGNSRRFWARVEDDDPFLPRAAGGRLPTGDRAEAWFDHPVPSHEPTAASRVPRAEGSQPPPMPRAARAEPAPRPAPQAPPKPQPRPSPPAAEAPPVVEPAPPPAARPPTPARPAAPLPPPVPVPPPVARPSAPESVEEEDVEAEVVSRAPAIPRKVQYPTVNPDPRRAPPPPRPPPARPATDAPSAAVDRAPPRPPPAPPRPPAVPGRLPPPPAGAARPAAPPPPPPAAEGPRAGLVDRTGRSATEVRREKELAKQKPHAHLPPRRSLDDVLGMLGDLDAGARLYQEKMAEAERAKKAGKSLPSTDGGFYDRPDPPRPLPKVVSPAKASAAPPRPPTPAASAPPRPAAAPPRPPTPAAPPRPPAPPPRPPAAAAAPPRPPAGAAAQGSVPRPPIAPPPRPAGRAAPEDDDDVDVPPSPPMKGDAPVNRSPRAALQGAAGPNLDDLFGGGPQEGRVKIGRRTQPKPTPGEGENPG